MTRIRWLDYVLRGRALPDGEGLFLPSCVVGGQFRGGVGLPEGQAKTVCAVSVLETLTGRPVPGARVRILTQTDELFDLFTRGDGCTVQVPERDSVALGPAVPWTVALQVPGTAALDVDIILHGPHGYLKGTLPWLGRATRPLTPPTTPA